MKLRNLKKEIFTGSDPSSLTNADGDTFETWISDRSEEVLIEPLIAETVGSELWLIVMYAEG